MPSPRRFRTYLAEMPKAKPKKTPPKGKKNQPRANFANPARPRNKGRATSQRLDVIDAVHQRKARHHHHDEEFEREERRDDEEIHEVGRPSNKPLRRFMKMVEPSARRATELKYLRMLADPDEAPLVGIPLALAGVPSKSVKLRMNTTTHFQMGSGNTSAMISFPNYAVKQFDNRALSWNFGAGNNLPKWAMVSGDPNPKVVQGVVGAIATDAGPSTASTPAFGIGLTDDPGVAVGSGDPGVSLIATKGRIIAQEVRVYPTSNIVDSQGTITMYQTTYGGDRSLNNKTEDELYATQGLYRSRRPIAGWDPTHCMLAVRVPTQPDDFNWGECDWVSAGAPASPLTHNQCGGIWAACSIEGAQAEMTFRVDVTTVYEFSNSTYSFATANNAPTGDASLPTGLAHHVKPGLALLRNPEGSSPDRPSPQLAAQEAALDSNRGDSAVFDLMKNDQGPKTAAAEVAHAQQGGFGEELAEFAVDILPEIIGMFL